MLRDAKLELRDGRALAFSEWGEGGGVPVFYFHGLPGGRLECWGGQAAYAASGVRLFTVDRPGIGDSDPKPERRLLDWPVDVAELADALDIRRFAVMGHSAGGAYALACASRLSSRVVRAGLVGSVPPLDRPEGIERMGTARYWRLADRRPSLMRARYRLASFALRLAPTLGHRLYFARASEADRAVVDRREVRQRFRTAVLEAISPGVGGLVEDMRVLMRPWGFRPEEVTVEVLLWQGADDHHVSPTVLDDYSQAIPRCRAKLVDAEGHFSLLEARAAEIARAVANGGQRRRSKLMPNPEARARI
jgi:pimeloyl-ACP methyl ester carboxylesterase